MKFSFLTSGLTYLDPDIVQTYEALNPDWDQTAEETFTGWEPTQEDKDAYEDAFSFVSDLGYNPDDPSEDISLGEAKERFPDGIDPFGIHKEVHKNENQRRQGSCQGASLSSGMEASYWLQTGKPCPQISKNAAYRLSQVEDGIRGDKGSTLSGGQKAAKKGICSESIWGYTETYQSRIPNAVYEARKSGEPNKDIFRLESSVPLRKTNSPHKQVLTKMVEGWGFPQIGMAWTGMDGSGWRITSYRGGRGGGHAVFFPGFFWEDDELWFWLANSWGQGWGKNGFKAVHYRAFDQIMKSGWNMGYINSDLKDVKEKREIDFSFITDF